MLGEPLELTHDLNLGYGDQEGTVRWEQALYAHTLLKPARQDALLPLLISVYFVTGGWQVPHVTRVCAGD
jgi:hypothetical protein